MFYLSPMAQKIITTVISDLSGKPEAEPVRFGWDGVVYEIDLTSDERRSLDRALAKYVGAARRTGGRKVRRS
jgi:hypothetical protein